MLSPDCSIASTLGQTNAWCATLGVGSVDSHTFFVGFVGFGQAGLFILCEGDAVVKEQVVAIAQALERSLNVLTPGYFSLPAVFTWIRG